MLDNLSKYVYEIYRCKSVSMAAKKLYISQPALSASLKKAEDALGSPIFNRKTIPFTLTAEGKIYIDAIEQVLQLQQQTHDRIQDIREIKSGHLNIATSTNISNYIIPKICEQFRAEHPHVDINIIIAKTGELYDMLTKCTADLVFIPTDTATDEFTVIPLLKENIMVAARRDVEGLEALLPFALSYYDVISRNHPADKLIRDMSVFHGVDFIYSPPDSNIFKKRRMIFGESGTSSDIYTYSANQKLNYNLMQSGFGALLTTDADIATMPENDNCVYFALKNPAAKQIFSIAHSKVGDSPSYRLVNEFVKTAKEFFNCENPLKKIL